MQWPFALAGHFTRTGALPFFTVTVWVGIRTPANGEVVVGHGAVLVPAWFVAFGVGVAIWTVLSPWRCADIPFAGTAPWNDPVPDVLTKLETQPQVMQLYGVPPIAV